MTTIAKAPYDEAVIRSGAADSPCCKRAAYWVLAATIMGSSISFIDGPVVNIALPVLQRELGTDIAGAQWIVEAYSLMLSALMLVDRSLGDRMGRKRIFSLGIPTPLDQIALQMRAGGQIWAIGKRIGRRDIYTGRPQRRIGAGL